MAEQKKEKIKEKIVKKEKKPEEKKERRGLFRRKKEAKPAHAEKKIELKRDVYDILKFVLMTEKSVRQIELQNRLVFIVDRKSHRDEIKAAAERAFNVPVRDVKTMIDQSGRKKAFIIFTGEGAAGEIAVRLGII